MNTWYNEAIFYHIYPLGLLGAPKENREEETVHRMKELLPWISHIKDLGCTAIYIGPLFESTSHGYDTRDYKRVDRRLGDNEDFKEFVEECHASGIRVVVDGVFNHTGREFFAFQDIQKNREGSPYCKWYKGINFGWNNPYNDGFGYEAWRNCFELVNLNLYEREVKDYLLDVIRFWIQEFDIDGIRLDCADCLDFEFMKEMRSVTAGEKKDFWLMGEVIHGDYARWVNDEMLHSVTNYELHKGLYSGHNDHNYFEIAHTIRRQFDENGGIYRGRTLYSFADNHDVDRLASKLKNKEHMFPEYTLLYTLPGIPSIYYGSEWGMEGKKEGPCDDYLRPAIKLTDMEGKAEELLNHLKALGKLKKENPELSYGKYRELVLTNRQYAFARILDNEAVIVAVNNDENPAEIRVPLPIGGKVTDAFSEEEMSLEGGNVKIALKACGSVCLKVKN
ncbi:MAG TPA: alpha-glucosidase C-terminal domain-containing protein [Candidatus Limivivens merdigallinarum]|uniref:Alpha-glucosidase C-terminal domain-containing protein n=1 Tax=Candidatus Limivivens merdigallinarum TaxID=2840859 RepID=A0A9D0ZX22_9FIRM|nr:alpha-glucosidase C-terminal domain-containing protein [Candidatus Limivivens merdigallinarum]